MGKIRRDDAGSAVGRAPRRTRRIVVVGAALLVVALVGVVAAVSWARATGPTGPVEAVEEYLGLLEDGEAQAASALVDPSDHAGLAPDADADAGSAAPSDALTVDEGLLTDEVFASSAERLSLDSAEIDLDRDREALEALPVGAVVAVEVEYSVSSDRRSSTAVLRTERLADTGFGAHRWRVIDPLVVPVAIETNLLEAGPASLAGAPVPLSMSVVDGATRNLVMMYPGIYPVTGTPETYLSAPPLELIVEHDGAVKRDGSDLAVVSAELRFAPTAALREEAASRLTEYLDECLVAGAEMDAACPAPLRRLAAIGEITVTRTPEVDAIGTSQLEFLADGTSVDLPLGMISTTGTVEATTDDGQVFERAFVVTARIVPEGDDVRIEFYSSPS